MPRTGSIVAVDPGGTTGIAWGPMSLVDTWDASLVKWDEVKCVGDRWWSDGEVRVCLAVLMKIKETNARAVVIEDFALTPGRVLTKDGLSPVRIEAMLRFALSQKWFDGLYISQSPSGKRVASDARLARAGLDLPPKSRSPHARDAVRHLVLFLRRLKKGEVELP